MEVPKTNGNITRKIPGASLYHSVSWMYGFRESYSLILYIFAGGLPRVRRDILFPLWYQRALSNPRLRYVAVGIMAVPQLLPAIRRTAMRFRRVSGKLSSNARYVLLGHISFRLSGS
uniref:Uncharacterized protein n=1 Tax=Moniliophthora roreri TaxID=221103 RepID=A0A0W0FQH2_MONRR